MRVPSTEVQNNFGKYLKFAEANEEIIITKNGRDVAKLVRCEPETAGEEAEEYLAEGERVTYEQYLELTENSEHRYELIDGVLYFMASPSYGHQAAVSELNFAFRAWFKGKPCSVLPAPFDVTLVKSPANICVVQPDIVVLCDKENIDEKGKYKGVPVLVVEVLSPGTRVKDMIKKLNLYHACGVKEYWIVDPEQKQIDIYAFRGENDIVRVSFNSAQDSAASVIFEGLTVSLNDVFSA